MSNLKYILVHDLFFDSSFDPSSVKVPWWSKSLAYLMSKGTVAVRNLRSYTDCADC